MALDEGEAITVFKSSSSKSEVFKVSQAEGIPEETAKKDLFGMGYPYFISGYDRHVAVTTDYGILLFSVERSVVAAARQQH